MNFDCWMMIASYILAFIGGFLIMLFIYLRKPKGTIVIEKYPDTDLFRFDMPLSLEEIEKKKRIIFKVRIEHYGESK